MHDWPVVKLNGIQEDYIKTIIKKLVTRSLTFGDIEGTVFNDLYFNFYSSSDNDEEKDIAKEQMLLNCAFESLINVQLTENGEIFAIYDTYSDAPSFEFFGDYELMTTVFGEKYVSVDTRWEDLDDDDLSQWLDRLEENYQGIPFACLGPDEEEE